MSKPIGRANVEPTQELLAGWADVNSWSWYEAVPLAFGMEPTRTNTSFDGYHGGRLARLPDQARPYLTRATEAERYPHQVTSPRDWLWWGDKSGMWFHPTWWYAITPEGPIGPDGRHVVDSRERRRSECYQTTLRELIMQWSKARSWHLDTAVLLTMNICPTHSGDQEAHLGESDSFEFRRRREQLMRASSDGALKRPLRPRAVLNWAVGMHWFIEPAWFRAVPEDYETKVEDNETVKEQATSAVAEDKAINPRVQDTLLKMIAGMAIKGYVYDPQATRSDTAAEIAGDVRELGLQISVDTVRTYLRQGMELIDQNVLTGIGKKH